MKVLDNDNCIETLEGKQLYYLHLYHARNNSRNVMDSPPPTLGIHMYTQAHMHLASLLFVYCLPIQLTLGRH